MSRKPTPAVRRELAEANRQWPPYLVPVDPKLWPPSRNPGCVELWRSRTFLAQVCAARDGAELVSVNRTAVDDAGRWRDGITWDELQDVKRQIGRGDRWAVEVYPPESEIENVANMRHLWLLETPPAFGFRPSERR